jgi:E3 ubiquitin-protein ligase MARCH6
MNGTLVDPESPGSVQRPLMPTRDRSFIATGIRRSLEEGNEWSFEDVPQPSQQDTSEANKVPDSWDDEEHEKTQAGPAHDGTSDQEQNSEHSSESWQQVAEVIADSDSDQVLEGERSQDKGKSKAVDDSADVPSESSVEDGVHDTGEAAEADVSSNESEQGSASYMDFSDSEDEGRPALQHAAAEQAQETQAVPPPVAQPQPHLMNRLLDWTFGDVAPAVPPTEEPGSSPLLAMGCKSPSTPQPKMPRLLQLLHRLVSTSTIRMRLKTQRTWRAS